MDELPSDWRTQLVDMVRGARPLSGAWFTGGPVCTPLEQVGIYADQYGLRLGDALLEEIPGSAALLSPAVREDLLAAYLRDCPSTSFTLNRVADRFAEWLEAQGAEASLVDMARLDRAVMHGFEAREGEPLDPAQLATLPRLTLQPHATLLVVGHNVHEIRSACQTKAALPPLRAERFALLVYRSHRKMKHWVLPWPLHALLFAIEAGASVPDAIEQIHAQGLVDVETLATDVGTWFQWLAERQVLALRDPPGV